MKKCKKESFCFVLLVYFAFLTRGTHFRAGSPTRSNTPLYYLDYENPYVRALLGNKYMSAPIIVSARKMPFMISSSWILVACRFSYYRHYSLERPTQSKAAWLAMFDDFLLIFVYFPIHKTTLRVIRRLWGEEEVAADPHRTHKKIRKMINKRIRYMIHLIVLSYDRIIILSCYRLIILH